MEQASRWAFVLIALGGFVGASSRYALAVWLPTVFPWGTLVANVLGSFALGVVLSDQHLTDRLSVESRLLLGTGFCSSFTTYSTFAAETVSLSPLLAVTNVVANYLCGFGAVLLGRAVVRWAM